MLLSVHYVPENKTWPQGAVQLICSDGYSLNFAAERKYLIYGVKPSEIEGIKSTICEAAENGNELLLTVNNGVGGYIWGIVSAEITGIGDGVTCKVELEPGEPAVYDISELDPCDGTEETEERLQTVKSWIENGIT